MISFELGKEIEKDIFFALSRGEGQRKSSESPRHMNFIIDLTYLGVSVAQR